MIAAASISAFANEGPIAADRPGFSTGTYTVKPDCLAIQIEAGWRNHLFIE